MDPDLSAARSLLNLDPALPAIRLGGLTNRVFRIGDTVLRLPGAGTEAYINRAHEAQSARSAARAGVAPAVLHADPATGLMATAYLPGTTTMTPETFRSIPGSPVRAGQALAKLHRSGAIFPARFELFAMIDDYLALLDGTSITLPPGYDATLAQAQAVRTALSAAPVPLVPCHCDPLCENFLDDGVRMWIVDWEYCGMNDPMWDLGDLSVEAGFTPEQEAEMLAGYGATTPQDRARMVLCKAMCDLLWTLWGLIQLANANPADDFRVYADTRLARCRALMATREFADSLRRLGG